MKRIIFTVTGDPQYDRRMIRICDSLVRAGYAVTLVGRAAGKTTPAENPFRVRHINAFFKRGPLFYITYNIQLFFFLLFSKADAFCAIDLDTILPVYWASAIRRKKRVYDAHELFTEMKEVVTRPRVKKIWDRIAKKYVPRFKDGYTVSKHIAEYLEQHYGVRYAIIRNLPNKSMVINEPVPAKMILYQGAVNEGRGFEWLIPAMRSVPAQLHIYGAGNFSEQAKRLVAENGLSEKIIFKGMVSPAELERVTATARVGINLVENLGLNQYYSLANKFFDYINHRVPQVTMNFPEYAAINSEAEVALLLDELTPETIASAINRLLSDDSLYQELRENCGRIANIYNWENQEKKLTDFYNQLFA